METPSQGEPQEGEGSPENVAEEVAAAPVRAPAERVLPELSSVRWGPDRREPFESLAELDTLIRAHLGRPARVAARMRARHGRERMTLAVVLAVKENERDMEDEFIQRFLQFDGAPITDEAEAVDRREGEVNDTTGDSCRCGAEAIPDLLLVRVVHGAGERANRIDEVRLPGEVCTGRGAELSLADYDRDGRVEVRSIVSYSTDVSCGVQNELYTRLYVVDIADLVLQVNIATDHVQEHYYAASSESTRARFTPINEDEHPDIQIAGSGVDGGDEDVEGNETRFAIRQSWLYDITSDTWARAPEE